MTDWSSVRPPTPPPASGPSLHSHGPPQPVYINNGPRMPNGDQWQQQPSYPSAPYPSFAYFQTPPTAHAPYTTPSHSQHLSLSSSSPVAMPSSMSHHSNVDPTSPPGSLGGKRPLGGEEETSGKKQRSLSDESLTTAPIKRDRGAKGGPKNCKECRRTKSKCDRVFPCSNCRKKGCSLACPDSDLSCMIGKRLVLASTEQLHERITLLESALFQAHASQSKDPHPLLSADFLDPSHKPTSPQTELTSPVDDDLVEKSNRAWASENASPALRRESSNAVDQMADRLRSQSLEDRQKALQRLPELMRALPPRAETLRRAKLFWSRSRWFPNILRQRDFEDIYMPAAYEPTPQNPVSPHKLACVFITLAFSAFLDLDNHAPDDPVIGEFFDNAQACFETRFFGFGVSVPGVQALGTMALFVQFGWPGGGNWSLLRQMTTAVQQMGLHRELVNSKLSEAELDLRRRVFHEAFMLDCILSLTAGQRIALAPEEIDVQYPSDASAEDLMKYSYMRDNYSRILQIALRPESHPAPPSMLQPIEDVLMQYSRENCPALHCIGWVTGLIPDETDDPTRMDVPDLTLCANTMSHYKALGFLHRPSLRRIIARIRPLLDHGGFELLESEKHVIRLSYEAAEAISCTFVYMYRTHPSLCQRLWFVWVQAFSALVTITAIATFIPRSYPSAHHNLARMVDYFSAAGPKSQAAELLPLVQQLRVILARRDPATQGDRSRGIPESPDYEGENMLYALLGGTAPTSSHGMTHSENRLVSAPAQPGRASFPHPHAQPPFEPPAYTPHPAAVYQAMQPDAWLERAQYFYEPTPYGADIPVPTWNVGSDYAGFV